MRYWRWLVCVGIGLVSTLAHAREQDEIVLTILYDNVANNSGLTTNWGFACLIYGMEKNILFDTGANAQILSKNFEQCGYYTLGVETVVISHLHKDHTGGIASVLDNTYGRTRNVFLPERVPESFAEYAESLSAIAPGCARTYTRRV